MWGCGAGGRCVLCRGGAVRGPVRWIRLRSGSGALGAGGACRARREAGVGGRAGPVRLAPGGSRGRLGRVGPPGTGRVGSVRAGSAAWGSVTEGAGGAARPAAPRGSAGRPGAASASFTGIGLPDAGAGTGGVWPRVAPRESWHPARVVGVVPGEGLQVGEVTSPTGAPERRCEERGVGRSGWPTGRERAAGDAGRCGTGMGRGTARAPATRGARRTQDRRLALRCRARIRRPAGRRREPRRR